MNIKATITTACVVGGAWIGGMVCILAVQAFHPTTTANDIKAINAAVTAANVDGNTAATPEVGRVEGAHIVTFTSKIKPKDKDETVAKLWAVFDSEDQFIGTLAAK